MILQTQTAVTEQQNVYRIVVTPTSPANNEKQMRAAHQLGLASLTACYPSRLYFLQGNLNHEDTKKLAQELLADPVTEELEIREWGLETEPDLHSQFSIHNPQFTIEVTLLPGVTDPPAENLLRAAHVLGINGLERVATGQRYMLAGDMSAADKQRLAAEVLANPVIQRFAIDAPITPPFFPHQEADETVDMIPVREADEEELLALSKERRLALNLAEMQAIQAYYRQEGRDATDVELEMLAQTWSEHCVHKTFKAIIEYTGPDGKETTINGLLNTYIRAATEKVNKPWVYSAFVDNAGIIAFDDQFDLAFKVETHNHPSALEPFGGANTGVGGVVRDVLGVSARPIANTDILCFGPPDLSPDDVPAGVLHPRRIADGVIHGIEDYGNKMGIPTVNGSIHYHTGYTANPLVYCGCLGILPHGSHVTEPQPGDLIIAIGGRTGRDGLRGATFSSMEMDVETSEIAGTAVQIGHPIMEKQVQEVVLRARDEGLYTAITDCGAGGYSSAVGEMGDQLGAKVQLKNMTLKYPGLRPWEIWLSEAQERMVLAVPPQNLPRLQAICDGQDVELIQLGTFADDGQLQLYYGHRLVGDLRMSFLHDGLPQRRMKAVWRPVNGEQFSANNNQLSPTEALMALLSHPNVRSKEDVIRRYDHEVQGGTAVKPLVGIKNHGPGDATVLVPQNSQLTINHSQFTITKGTALSNGICPNYSALDPYHMAWAAIDEAMRNVVAVGADPDQVAILDNFCWGNPSLPDRLGSLVRCAQGCYDAAVAYGTPFISGKDSLNNEYTGADGRKHAIPGTLLISALGMVPDVHKTVTMDFKASGSRVYVVGETEAELGASLYAILNNQSGGKAPQPKPDALSTFRTLHRAITSGLVPACHDCAEGGLAVALAEMSLAGGIGVEAALDKVPGGAELTDTEILFSESLSRFVVEVDSEQTAAFEQLMRAAHIPLGQIGTTTENNFTIQGRDGERLIDVSPAELEQAWRGHIEPRGRGAEEQRGTRFSPAPLPPRSSAPSHTPRVLILHANGTNRDQDAALACQLAGGDPEIVHINQLLSGECRLVDYHMLVLPGGFSYGDDLGAGVVWALDLQHRLQAQMAAFVADGRPVLGICNGFQTLVKSGLLPGGEEARSVTLTYNQSGQFECRWVYLQPNPDSPSLFTRGLTAPIYCPVAHGEGRFAIRDESVTAVLQSQNLIPLAYVKRNGAAADYPTNPNGSVLNIAALCNSAGNVMGLMPHPENHIFPWQHPRHHRGEQGLLGLRLFENGMKHA